MGTYFVKVDCGPDLRRKLLESSKGSLHILVEYQMLLQLRQQKHSLMGQLRAQLRELTILLNRAEALTPKFSETELTQMLPKRLQPVAPPELPALPKGKWVRKGGKKIFVPASRIVKEVPRQEMAKVEKGKAQLARLESQLRVVEEKLSGI